MIAYTTYADMTEVPMSPGVLNHITLKTHTFNNGYHVSIARHAERDGEPAGEYVMHTTCNGEPMRDYCMTLQLLFQVNITLREIAELEEVL
jgi:hypothetical protein